MPLTSATGFSVRVSRRKSKAPAVRVDAIEEGQHKIDLPDARIWPRTDSLCDGLFPTAVPQTILLSQVVNFRFGRDSSGRYRWTPAVSVPICGNSQTLVEQQWNRLGMMAAMR
jgi:hypothetical protein